MLTAQEPVHRPLLDEPDGSSVLDVRQLLLTARAPAKMLYVQHCPKVGCSKFCCANQYGGFLVFELAIFKSEHAGLVVYLPDYVPT